MEDLTFNVEEARMEQEKYCAEKKLPHFAPYSGICYSCNRQIYDAPNGYSVEYASSKLVTGCPFCMASYCD